MFAAAAGLGAVDPAAGAVAAGALAAAGGVAEFVLEPPTAATAFWQEPESFALFCCRQASAAEPPVGTLAQ